MWREGCRPRLTDGGQGLLNPTHVAASPGGGSQAVLPEENQGPGTPPQCAAPRPGLCPERPRCAKKTLLHDKSPALSGMRHSAEDGRRRNQCVNAPCGR